MSFETRIKEAIAKAREQHLLRVRTRVRPLLAPYIEHEGQRFINFSSNDYLGLSQEQSVKQAAIEATQASGVGAASSQFVSGYQILAQKLEHSLQAFLQRQAVMLFPTGYMANLGVLQALAQKGDVLFQDRLNHASLIDAGILSQATAIRYQHNDMTSLERRLQQHTHSPGAKCIVTDGLFSMDGDVARLDTVSKLANAYNSWVMVDDAHGVGLLGQHGAGTIEKFALSEKQVQILTANFAKTLGAAGAFVAGPRDLIEYLQQKARTAIYTTGLSPMLVGAAIRSLEIIQHEPWRRQQLFENVLYFRQYAGELGLSLASDAEGPIQPILIGDNAHCLTMAKHLRDQGFFVTAIRPPTVPKNTARLRLTIMQQHTRQHIERLLDSIAELMAEKDRPLESEEATG